MENASFIFVGFYGVAHRVVFAMESYGNTGGGWRDDVLFIEGCGAIKNEFAVVPFVLPSY
jgi:hypothetical protein